MIRSQTLMLCIEDLRLKKHLTLQVFTDGIISERTYRRYLNESEAFTFEVLVLLVQKLGMRMRDVLTFAFNQTSVKHQEEIYFAHYMTLRKKELAEPFYHKLVNKTFETHLGSIYIPILIQYYHYPKDYMRFSKDIIHFKMLHTISTLNRQTLDAMLFMLPDLNEKDTLYVISCLLRVLNQEVILLSMTHALDMSKVLHKVFQLMTQSKERVARYMKDIPIIYQKALNDVLTHHMQSVYEDFFESVIMYARHTGDIEKANRFIYYDVCYQLSLDIVEKDRTHIYALKDGKDIYLKHAQSGFLLSREVI